MMPLTKSPEREQPAFALPARTMMPLKSVILHHTLPRMSHFDWMFENPRDPGGPLICLRLGHLTLFHDRRAVALLEELSPHRRIYLEYQGIIAPLNVADRRIERGRVERVMRGRVFAQRWNDRDRLIQFDWRGWEGWVRMVKAGDRTWRAIRVDSKG
ncbi:MAG: hypothetical protein JJU36_02430 [Phycisphaeraceae bacterium]|nr:hypothetical protein [Phycisphaeraceae bacterium]